MFHFLSFRIRQILVGVILALGFSSCAELQRPIPEPFYSQTEPPLGQEFRWCNGKTPKTLDPARAISPPETDFARSLFEGLTSHDPKSLDVIPATATKWTSTKDFKIWTFTLRQKARWSNGENVTANDFVNSWRRLSRLQMGSQLGGLVSNIVGFETKSSQLVVVADEGKSKPEKKLDSESETSNKFSSAEDPKDSLPIESQEALGERAEENSDSKENPTEKYLGVEAIDDLTLRVTLVQPDKDFPALVAHPIFSPVYKSGIEFVDDNLKTGITTNGAFRVASVTGDGISLERSENYWNREDVLLERVRFVPAENAEAALGAYRAGEIDAITNAEFEPLALKLLSPFDDFRIARHAALNLYEFNLTKPPFDDRRVREALSSAIERSRITNDEMGGASFPAERYLPFSDEKKILENDSRAREKLAEAGFENGKGFPVIAITINRNDLQKRVAREVSEMWKTKLNIESEILTLEQTELDSARATGNFDIVRRGVVFSSTDEVANMLTIFGGGVTISAKSAEQKRDPFTVAPEPVLNGKAETSGTDSSSDEKNPLCDSCDDLAKSGSSLPIISEDQALRILPSIPLYFPSSYALVKPYVKGFEMNVLDAVVLRGVSIDRNWKPTKER